MAESSKVPKHLTAKTRRWYAEITEAFELEPQHLLLLQAAAESWDRAQEARVAVAAEGLTFKDRHGNLRPHPCLQVERDNRALFARLIRELALDVSEPEESRPPTIHGRAALRAQEG